jgi:site-specific recombinase XerD
MTATHLLDTGETDIRFVQEWLRRANIQNTIIYASLVSTTREGKHFFKLPKF